MLRPYLNALILNYKDRLKSDKIQFSDYTDEELFKVIDYWSGMENSEEQYEAIKEDIKYRMKR